MAIVLALCALLVLFVAAPRYVLKLALVAVLLCVSVVGVGLMGLVVFDAIAGAELFSSGHEAGFWWGLAGLASMGGLRAILK